MKIAFVTTYDAQDVNNWSGTPFYMSKAFLDAGVEVEFIGNLKNCSNYFSFRVKNLLYNRILNKKFGIYNRQVEPKSLKYFAKQVYEMIQQSNADIILSPSAWPIAYLKIGRPIILWADATFANMVNYYPGFAGLSRLTKNNFDKYERNALSRTSLSCFSSDWAAKSAIEYYKADHRKIKVIPFGANLDSSRTINDIIQLNKNKSRAVCELLFVGQDWERKGAATAIEIAGILNSKGLKTVLHLVGLKDIPLKDIPEFVLNYGFLRKSVPKEKSKIEELFMKSHFFVLPTKADCTPMVFGEANSFGLPVITFNTGGISSVITNDINGKMFDPEINIEECANYIKCVFSDSNRYNGLSLAAFNEYKTKLNWSVSISTMISYMENILSNNNE